jgi:alginate O-acetyltransferase complex protein AlgI
VSLIQILVFILITTASGLTARGRWRGWTIFVLSVFAVFWLQPASTIRHADFWFPIASLALTVLTWRVSGPRERTLTPEDRISIGLMLVIPILISLAGNVIDALAVTPTRPPGLFPVLIALLGIALLFWINNREGARNQRTAPALILLLLALFIALKHQPLAEELSRAWRALNAQATEHASSLDLGWLGFSYIAFRLLHTLRDRSAGRLPEVSLREYVSYVLFFPALTAGPIDRVERFQADLQSAKMITAKEGLEGGRRIALGVFKKFVLADSLALIALNPINADQARSTGWLWILLYAYAFRLYFDFSGYTDVAIGLGQLTGVKLPENFEAPYLKKNLAAFWTSWHITLAQWFRSYFFNPLTRALRRGRIRPFTAVSIFIAQVSTMVLIGLWHGIALNFLIWGAWHGIGLYLHNRWTELKRTRDWKLPSFTALSDPLGLLLTFHFVTLGWVWFLLPDAGQAGEVFLRLLGG